jgi:hypothetical protein
MSAWIFIIGSVLLYFEEEPGRWSDFRHVDKLKHFRWFAKGLDHRCTHRRLPSVAAEIDETRALREDVLIFASAPFRPPPTPPI